VSLHEYVVSRELERQDVPFYALIMAAARKADSANLERLEAAFPEAVAELRARYNAPGGEIPEDHPPAPPGPVCSRCEDTHTMTLRDRYVPCTFCPTPCPSCRGHLTAYCRTTPCPCACHPRRRPS
jgi:hypothetical protein